MKQEHSYQDDELIPVMYGRDLSEANYYKSLLDDHEIPAVVVEEVVLKKSDEEDRSEAESGIPVLVPEEQLADAQDILEQDTEQDDDFEEEEADSDDEKDEYVGFQEEDADLENY